METRLIRCIQRRPIRRIQVIECEYSGRYQTWSLLQETPDTPSVETEFPAIVFHDNLTSNETLSYEPTVSSLNNNETDFKLSFDESDDEDYTVVFDKNSFSYKIIHANDLKTDSENDNEKVNMPLFLSPEPKVSCIDDLDFFKDFENKFPAIVYNDALTSKSDFSTEPTLCPQHIDEFDFKDETSLSKYYEEEQNVLYFNDLFPFNIIYPDDQKSDKDNDDNEIDMIQSSGGNENTQGSNKLLEESYDKINKVFIMKSFVMELNVNIVAWNYLVNGMLFNLVKNLPRYVFFTLLNLGKIGLQERIRRIRLPPIRHMALPPRDQRHQYLRYEGLQYTDADLVDFETRLARIYRREVHRVQVFNFEGLPDLMAEGLRGRMLMEHRDAQGKSMFGEEVFDLDIAGALQFQLGEVRRRMSWREFILSLGLHTAKEMQTVGFGLYWAESARQIPDKGDLCAYWIGISLSRDFLGTPPSYTLIRDPMLRLCHRLIARHIAGSNQAPEKVTVTGLFYLRGMDVDSVNVPYLLARYLRLFASGRKQGDMISGAPGPERQPDAAAGAPEAVEDAPIADEGASTVPTPVQVPQPPPPVARPSRTIDQRLARVEEDVHKICGALGEQREILDSMACDFSRFSTWTVVVLS
ncbi:hypothetical protein Tco_0635882 [Tanacetum coccineum]